MGEIELTENTRALRQERSRAWYVSSVTLAPPRAPKRPGGTTRRVYAPTIAVGLLDADAVPSLFVAVDITRSVLPISAATGLYVFVVTPMSPQLAPAASHRCHLRVTVVCAFWVEYTPAVLFSAGGGVLTFAVPVIVGIAVFTGGVGHKNAVVSAPAIVNFVSAGQAIAPLLMIVLGNTPANVNVPSRPVGVPPPAVKPAGYTLVCVSAFAQPETGLPPVST